jgi:hypothetical protein
MAGAAAPLGFQGVAARGGSCLRERRCSSEMTTALPKMAIAVHTAAKARRSASGAQDS